MHSMKCCRQLRTKENEKNLAAQRLNYLKEKEAQSAGFLQKAEGQLKGMKKALHLPSQQVAKKQAKLEEIEGTT